MARTRRPARSWQVHLRDAVDAEESQIGVILDGFYDAVRRADEWSENATQVSDDQEPDEDGEVGDTHEIAGPTSVTVGETAQVRQARIGQVLFSRAARENYGHRCCSPGCEVDHDAFLIGA